MACLRVFILHCLFLDRKCIMVYILLGNNIVMRYNSEFNNKGGGGLASLLRGEGEGRPGIHCMRMRCYDLDSE